MALSASCLVVYVKKQQPARKEEVEIRNWLTSIYTGERERERERHRTIRDDFVCFQIRDSCF
jgi:hypothetical protein